MIHYLWQFLLENCNGKSKLAMGKSEKMWG
jgi:hypothetical protein